MKKNKILFLIFSISLFTGCTVNYNIDIDSAISENISFIELNSKINNNIYADDINSFKSYKEEISDLNNYPTSVLSNQAIDIYEPQNKIDGTLYYDPKIVDKNKQYGIIFNAKYDIKNIEYVKIFNTCYDDVKVNSDNGIIKINIKGENICFKYYTLLDEINIKLKTKYKVLSNNATSKEGKYYIWTINKDNYNKQEINIEIDTTRGSESFSLTQILLIIFGVVFVFCGIIFLIVKAINKKNNKI